MQGDPEGALNNVLDRAIDGLSGWTRRQSPLKDKPAHGRVERFHATLEGLMRTWRNDVVKRYGVPLPAHQPTVAWLVRHCAWLHDRFVMKRQDQQTPFQRQMARDYPGVVIPIFETLLWREPGPHVLKFKEKWGVGNWAGRDNLADMHIILTRQGALTARSIPKLAPSEAAVQQLLLAAKGHPGRLKAMTDEPEVLPLPPAQSSTPIRPPEPAAAQDIAAEPAPATPAGAAEESKHCEEEQPEEKMKTDTQMDDVEEEGEAPVPRKRWRPPTRHLPAPCSEDYTPNCGGCTGKTYYHIKAYPHHKVQETKKFLRQLERGEQAQQSSSSSSAAVPGGADSSTAVPGGVDDSVEVPGKTTHQTLETVDVAPMAGVQPETQGEAEEGEPPYKAARKRDIVMVIDGEEDVPKVYYEEDDGHLLPTDQVHEGMQREFQLMKVLEVSERILRTDVPSGKKIWSTRWCHRRKGAGVRSRFVVRQFRDTDWETAFSGVPGLVVVRVLLCISTILESSAVPGDFSVAFMSTRLHDAEFIEPPIEAESDSRYVWKLRKALNGLKKASQLFLNYLSDILVDKLGFEKCSLVPTAFYHCETDLRTAIHVDDQLTIGEV